MNQLSEVTSGPLLWAAAAGMSLGSLYFGGLWLSVRGLTGLRHPLVWMALGFLVRSLLLLAGFYAVTHGQWPRLLACLSGFVLVRVVLVERASRMDTEAGPSPMSKVGRPVV